MESEAKHEEAPGPISPSRRQTKQANQRQPMPLKPNVRVPVREPGPLQLVIQAAEKRENGANSENEPEVSYAIDQNACWPIALSRSYQNPINR